MMSRVQMFCRVLAASLLLGEAFLLGEGADPPRGSAEPVPFQHPGALSSSVRVQSSPSQLQIVGQVGGRIEDVAVLGNYAYVGVGLRLVVLDVSDSVAPTEIAGTTPFPGFVEGVAVSGSLAYVAAGMAGLRIVDVSDPANPVETGAYDTPGYAKAVAVDGHHAFVADGHCGLRIVDITDSADPVEIAYAYALNFAFDVVVDSQYVYLAAAGAGMLVVDISNPAYPIEIGGHDTPGYAYGLDVAGDLAYVADGWEGVRVVSISDPKHPIEVASYDSPGWAFGVDVLGSSVYVADAFAGLRVLDVSDPANPTELGGYEWAGGHAGRVAVVRDVAYVADRNWGLRVVDVSEPGALAQVGFYGPLGHAVAVAVSGSYAYVAAATQGLRVVDISDLRHPFEVGGSGTQGSAIGVVVADDYAYVAVMCEGGLLGGLQVVDVSDPTHPTQVGFRPESEGCYRDIALANGMVYIPDELGLEVMDISSPDTPTVAGYIHLQGEEWTATTGVDVLDGLAYVAGDRGLDIVDVTDPSSPALIATYSDPPWVKGVDVAVAGNIACVTHHGGEALKITDVSDPQHPVRVAGYYGPTLPERITIADSIAYVAFGNAGLRGIDITDPANPALVSSCDTPGYAFASVVVGDQIYVADGQGGLVILETTDREPRAHESAWIRTTSTMTAADSRMPGQPPAAMPRISPRTLSKHYGKSGTHESGALSPSRQVNVAPRPNNNRAPETCVVTSAADSGPGTLRHCMEGAKSGDTITFDAAVFPPESPVALTLQTNLPGIWQGSLTIDASEAGVILDGSLVQRGTGISIDSNNNTIRGLQILNFSLGGVAIEGPGADNNTIGGDRTIGSGPLGQGNLISANDSGIQIAAGASGNSVVGNLIGTDEEGLRPLGNYGWGWGVMIWNSSNNTIGGEAAGQRNIISGNSGHGVSILGNAVGNVVTGNYIGTDVNGASAVGNGEAGVQIELGPRHNIVKGNLISGSNARGVAISDTGSSYNTVVGNMIGTDATGTKPLGNRGNGVAVGWGCAAFNRIGGTRPGEGNLISGNISGVELHGTGNIVLGNLIGTDSTGARVIANDRGVYVVDDTVASFIGGTTDAERNLISGNNHAGINAEGTERVFILGNYIGTDASGSHALGNGRDGIYSRNAKHTVIQGNVVGGNTEAGVRLGEDSEFGHLRANRIGVAADGVSPLPNGMDGVSIWAASNTIGGPYREDGNIIAFNTADGVNVWRYPSNTIRRNSIFANSGTGIRLFEDGNNLLAPPTITEVSATSVSGTACAGCVVDVFSDDEDEGRLCEGNTTADASGTFVFTKHTSLAGPNVTATATDSGGSTSGFSAPVAAPPGRERAPRRPSGRVKPN